jgi:hypothetical protein
MPTKFHENPLIGSKVISGGHTDTLTDRQAGDLINLLSHFWKVCQKTQIIKVKAYFNRLHYEETD